MLMMESVKQNSFNETKDSASIFVHRQRVTGIQAVAAG
jgi:hypothetical protein